MRITRGEGREGDLALLEDLGAVLADGSLCGLGQSAANPVLSTLRYFREEYEAHIQNHRCPAGVCKALITYTIDTSVCNGCGACLTACSQNLITGTRKKGETFKIDQAKCDRCGACHSVCKFDAIAVA